MKKIWLLVAVILLAVAVLGGALVYLLVMLPRLGQQAQEPTLPPFLSAEDYLSESWPDYRFAGLENEVLTLEYDVRGSFDQVQRHGLDAGFDELAAGHLETARLIARGLDMQCDLRPREVVVLGISSDGKEVYRASTVSGVTACWDR